MPTESSKKTKDQKAVDLLIDTCEPVENLTKWAKGYIPEHYKRLTAPRAQAIEIAIRGYADALSYFGVSLYFTQALIYGASVFGYYKDFVICTTSQWGKSFVCGMIAIRRAGVEKATVNIGGGDANTSEIIMKKVNMHLRTVHIDIRNKLLQSEDAIEKMQISRSKKEIGFAGGGMIKPASLGDSYNDAKRGNQAIGRGEDWILDEASRVSEDAIAESGRNEWSSDTGESFLRFEISNPHNPGRWWNNLTDPNPPSKRLIVWMDLRTALEEGSAKKTKEEVQQSEFYLNKSTCRRYLLCELEDLSEHSMFDVPVIDDSPYRINKMPREDYIYCLGVDSAYKGKDSVHVTLGAKTQEKGMFRLLDTLNIKKDNWIDGVTGDEVVQTIINVILFYNVKICFVDQGEGSYIAEQLAKRVGKVCIVKPIAFGGAPDKRRVEQKHYAALYAANKRAEMHMDLQDLIEKGQCTMTQAVYEGVKEQMSATKLERTTTDKLKIIPKDKIKALIGHSPDELDSCILCAHAGIMYYMMKKTFIYT